MSKSDEYVKGAVGSPEYEQSKAAQEAAAEKFAARRDAGFEGEVGATLGTAEGTPPAERADQSPFRLKPGELPAPPPAAVKHAGVNVLVPVVPPPVVERPPIAEVTAPPKRKRGR